MTSFKALHTTEIFKKIHDEQLSIAVAVEGGGLRGVISAAMLGVLKDFGLADQITSISGTSSGSINCAYFLNDNLDDCFALYKKMASSHFLQPHKWPNAMNLDYLFKKEIPNNHPLDCEQLKNHKVDFFITLSKIDTGETYAFKAQEQKKASSILKLLRGSASAPLYSTNIETIDGQVFNDGHLQMAIPYQPLLKTSADIILCLMTQKRGYKKSTNCLSKIHQKMALRNYPQKYKDSFSNSTALYNQQLDTIHKNPRLIPILLEPEDFIVSKMCKDPEQIDRSIESVRKRFLAHLT